MMSGGGIEWVSRPAEVNSMTGVGQAGHGSERCGPRSFQMPVHYPRYCREDYETMPESTIDALLSQYGLPAVGSLEDKRAFAIGAFLWP